MSKRATILLWAAVLVIALPSCTSSQEDPQPSASTRESPSAHSSAETPIVEDLEIGWGPERPMFTYSSPATHTVMNSLAGGKYGDERNFFRIKKTAATGDDTYKDVQPVEIGHTYTGLIWFQNAVSPSLIEASTENARAELRVAETFIGHSKMSVVLTADNASPTAVWDSAAIQLPKSTDIAALEILPESIVITVGGEADGQQLSSTDFTGEGALLGCDNLDGILSGDNGRCAGYIHFDFKVVATNHAISVGARSQEKGSFISPLDVIPEEEIEVRLEYRNSGTAQQNNVIAEVFTLPTNVQYVSNSTQLSTSKTDGYVSVTDIALQRINIGSYAPGGNAYVKFRVTIADKLGLNLRESGGSRWLDPNIGFRVATGDIAREAFVVLSASEQRR